MCDDARREDLELERADTRAQRVSLGERGGVPRLERGVLRAERPLRVRELRLGCGQPLAQRGRLGARVVERGGRLAQLARRRPELGLALLVRRVLVDERLAEPRELRRAAVALSGAEARERESSSRDAAASERAVS